MSLQRTAVAFLVPLTAFMLLSSGCASSIARMSVEA
jgi:hypothetical protein